MTAAFNLSQLANFVNSSGQLNAATGLTNTSSLGFPTGTLMLFQQTAAPIGWTKQTTHNNKALRVVSGTASSGGTSSFTTVFTNQTPTINASGLSASATTLTSSQMPSHTHTPQLWKNGAGTYGNAVPAETNNNNAQNFGDFVNIRNTSTGGGTSHTHGITGTATASAITLDIQYVDLIIAVKN